MMTGLTARQTPKVKRHGARLQTRMLATHNQMFCVVRSAVYLDVCMHDRSDEVPFRLLKRLFSVFFLDLLNRFSRTSPSRVQLSSTHVLQSQRDFARIIFSVNFENAGAPPDYRVRSKIGQYTHCAINFVPNLDFVLWPIVNENTDHGRVVSKPVICSKSKACESFNDDISVLYGMRRCTNVVTVESARLKKVKSARN
jgi:hypothetical protein